jgi:multicomponent Na+:H+ antiporter subunit F
MEPSPLVIQFAWIGTSILVAGMFLAFIRLALGPSLPDRVLAFDALAIMGVGLLVLMAIATGHALLLDVALALALITFLGTVAFAINLEKGIKK